MMTVGSATVFASRDFLESTPIEVKLLKSTPIWDSLG